MMVQTSESDIDFSVARPGTNVVLVAEKKEIHVNKEFLCAFSPYFNTLLQSHHFSEFSSVRVAIQHDYNQLLQCIQIIHGAGSTGKMTLSQIEDLLISADRFDLSVVRRFCESELVMGVNLCVNDAINSFLLASQYNLNKDALFSQTNRNQWNLWKCRKERERGRNYFLSAFDDFLPMDAAERQLHLNVLELQNILKKM